MEQWELVARESIRDLVARYNANGDSRRIDQVVELFAPDAIFDVRDKRYEGRDGVRSAFTGVVERAGSSNRITYVRHVTGTHQIDVVDESHATGRLYFFVITQVGLDHWGRYIDDYRMVDGAWKFAHRRVLLDDHGANSLFAPRK